MERNDTAPVCRRLSVEPDLSYLPQYTSTPVFDVYDCTPSYSVVGPLFFSSENRPGTVKDQFGYFIEEDLAAFDGAAFNIAPTILEQCDPQQRKLLEVAQECLDDAGETKERLQQVGVYVGSFAQDWSDMMEKDPLALGAERAMDGGAFSLANRLSHAMGLRGPSLLAIVNGDCAPAIVAGVNLILSPSMTGKISDQGVLSSDGSCKSFSADANGYNRGEAVNAIFITSMDAALRNGNPVRAVIRASLANSDGKTAGLSNPSMEAQEALLRQTYHLAGISDFSKTAFVECHGMGTPTGDPIEVGAVANVFGPSGVYIGSVKPNLGHFEGASGLTSLIKAILAVEHRAIPPNIRFSTPHPRIPFYQAGLTVPLKLAPWLEDRDERVSVSSFGIGGSDAHVIVESARSYGVLRKRQHATRDPQLLVFSAHSSASL
nr:fumagillin dodecapentaenoate synthase [Quercus suber]